MRRTEDDPINENNESDEEEKRKKKQEIKRGKKKQTETYDQDSRMQSPGMYNLIYFLILLIFYLDIPALGSSRSVGGIARSQSHGNAPNIGDFEEPSDSENGEMGQVFVYHLLDRPLPSHLFGTPLSFMLDDISVEATVASILQMLIESGNMHVQGKKFVINSIIIILISLFREHDIYWKA